MENRVCGLGPPERGRMSMAIMMPFGAVVPPTEKLRIVFALQLRTLSKFKSGSLTVSDAESPNKNSFYLFVEISRHTFNCS